jgi:hypothetical protein
MKNFCSKILVGFNRLELKTFEIYFRAGVPAGARCELTHPTFYY